MQIFNLAAVGQIDTRSVLITLFKIIHAKKKMHKNKIIRVKNTFVFRSQYPSSF